ncbi:MAG: nucleotidyltransferase domain-containing protein, partial [Nitrososphaerota archaeon]|nr:nucleotidyltransferase domain-containing protein [Candidatus Bathyarchaeota archaeon]MDW8194566.1 nucleotidyltransferase domain-containing protein [Nitrososphaerota archaeon]
MSLKGELASNLERIVDVLSKFEGVVCIILFGSYARGDYDAYSDYDLLVIFRDKSSMWKSWKELFKAVSSFRMNLHVIPEAIEEFEGANPVFLEELIKFGKVLYAKLPMEVFLKPLKMRPYALIIYDMSGLNVRDKMRTLYTLYRRGGGGLVAKSGGVKLCEGCILVPGEAADEILKALDNLKVRW